MSSKLPDTPPTLTADIRLSEEIVTMKKRSPKPRFHLTFFWGGILQGLYLGFVGLWLLG